MFENAIYFCDGKATFSAVITPVFSVMWLFTDLISYYYDC